MGGKKTVENSKKFEKERRDKLNVAFCELCKLLPDHDPSVVLSKMEILNKAAEYIKELQEQNYYIMKFGNDTVLKNEAERLKKRVAHLLLKTKDLVDILKDAGIAIPKEKKKKSVAQNNKPDKQKETAVEQTVERNGTQIFKKVKCGCVKLNTEKKPSKELNHLITSSSQSTAVTSISQTTSNTTSLIPTTVVQSGNYVRVTQTNVLNPPIFATRIQTIPLLDKNILSSVNVIVTSSNETPIISKPLISLGQSNAPVIPITPVSSVITVTQSGLITPLMSTRISTIPVIDKSNLITNKSSTNSKNSTVTIDSNYVQINKQNNINGIIAANKTNSPSKIQTVPVIDKKILSNLGPGTLILADGRIVNVPPVVPQITVVKSQPTVILMQTNKKKEKLIVPKRRAVTETTFANKAPIPAIKTFRLEPYIKTKTKKSKIKKVKTTQKSNKISSSKEKEINKLDNKIDEANKETNENYINVQKTVIDLERMEVNLTNVEETIEKTVADIEKNSETLKDIENLNETIQANDKMIIQTSTEASGTEVTPPYSCEMKNTKSDDVVIENQNVKESENLIKTPESENVELNVSSSNIIQNSIFQNENSIKDKIIMTENEKNSSEIPGESLDNHNCKKSDGVSEKNCVSNKNNEISDEVSTNKEVDKRPEIDTYQPPTSASYLPDLSYSTNNYQLNEQIISSNISIASSICIGNQLSTTLGSSINNIDGSNSSAIEKQRNKSTLKEVNNISHEKQTEQNICNAYSINNLSINATNTNYGCSQTENITNSLLNKQNSQADLNSFGKNASVSKNISSNQNSTIYSFSSTNGAKNPFETVTSSSSSETKKNGSPMKTTAKETNEHSLTFCTVGVSIPTNFNLNTETSPQISSSQSSSTLQTNSSQNVIFSNTNDPKTYNLSTNDGKYAQNLSNNSFLSTSFLPNMTPMENTFNNYNYSSATNYSNMNQNISHNSEIPSRFVASSSENLIEINIPGLYYGGNTSSNNDTNKKLNYSQNDRYNQNQMNSFNLPKSVNSFVNNSNTVSSFSTTVSTASSVRTLQTNKPVEFNSNIQPQMNQFMNLNTNDTNVTFSHTFSSSPTILSKNTNNFHSPAIPSSSQNSSSVLNSSIYLNNSNNNNNSSLIYSNSTNLLNNYSENIYSSSSMNGIGNSFQSLPNKINNSSTFSASLNSLSNSSICTTVSSLTYTTASQILSGNHISSSSSSSCVPNNNILLASDKKNQHNSSTLETVTTDVIIPETNNIYSKNNKHITNSHSSNQTTLPIYNDSMTRKNQNVLKNSSNVTLLDTVRYNNENGSNNDKLLALNIYDERNLQLSTTTNINRKDETVLQNNIIPTSTRYNTNNETGNNENRQIVSNKEKAISRNHVSKSVESNEQNTFSEYIIPTSSNNNKTHTNSPENIAKSIQISSTNKTSYTNYNNNNNIEVSEAHKINNFVESNCTGFSQTVTSTCATTMSNHNLPIDTQSSNRHRSEYVIASTIGKIVPISIINSETNSSTTITTSTLSSKQHYSSSNNDNYNNKEPIIDYNKNKEIDKNNTFIPIIDDVRLTSDFSSDLFSSLQVPIGGQHSDSISPTAAFLLAFPLVSTSKNVENLPENENHENQTSTPTTILQIGNIEPPNTELFHSINFQKNNTNNNNNKQNEQYLMSNEFIQLNDTNDKQNTNYNSKNRKENYNNNKGIEDKQKSKTNSSSNVYPYSYSYPMLSCGEYHYYDKEGQWQPQQQNQQQSHSEFHQNIQSKENHPRKQCERKKDKGAQKSYYYQTSKLSYQDYYTYKDNNKKRKTSNNNNRISINWMSASENRDGDFSSKDIEATNSLHFATSTAPSTFNTSMDLPLDTFSDFSSNKRPNNNNYSWSPSKSLLPSSLETSHLVLPSTLPTLMGDLALGTITPSENYNKSTFIEATTALGTNNTPGTSKVTSSQTNQHQSLKRPAENKTNDENKKVSGESCPKNQTNNFFSVSQLVDPKSKKQKTSDKNYKRQDKSIGKQRNNNNNLNYNNKRKDENCMYFEDKNNYIVNNYVDKRPYKGGSYSAESLIGLQQQNDIDFSTTNFNYQQNSNYFQNDFSHSSDPNHQVQQQQQYSYFQQGPPFSGYPHEEFADWNTFANPPPARSNNNTNDNNSAPTGQNKQQKSNHGRRDENYHGTAPIVQPQIYPSYSKNVHYNSNGLSTNTTTSLTNFNLSTIFPEMNDQRVGTSVQVQQQMNPSFTNQHGYRNHLN